MNKFIAVLFITSGLVLPCHGADPIWQLGNADATMVPLVLTKAEVIATDKLGAGIAFPGPGSRVQINDVPDFTESGETTISLFFRCDDLPLARADGSLGASALLSIDYDVLLRVYSNKTIYAGFRNDNGDLIGLFTTKEIVPGQWHHLTAIFSSELQSLKVYLDGEIAGQSIGPTGNLAPLKSNTMILGDDPDGSTFTGEIADIKIFTSAFEPDEVDALQVRPKQ